MQSERIDELAKALAASQKVMGLPKRNREVTVKSDKGSYKFEYTTLDAIIEHVREPLTTNGLWFVQIIAHEDGKTYLDTLLTHTSGQWLKSRAQINHQPGGRQQEFGSALTYMRRYALSALLGIASEDDDDANTADGNVITERRDRAPPPPAKRPIAPPPADEAKKWVGTATTAVKAFDTATGLNAWMNRNQPALDRLKAVEPSLWTDFEHVIAEQYAKLSTLTA